MTATINELTKTYASIINTSARYSFLWAISLILGQAAADEVQAEGAKIIAQQEEEMKIQAYYKHGIIE